MNTTDNAACRWILNMLQNWKQVTQICKLISRLFNYCHSKSITSIMTIISIIIITRIRILHYSIFSNSFLYSKGGLHFSGQDESGARMEVTWNPFFSIHKNLFVFILFIYMNNQITELPSHPFFIGNLIDMVKWLSTDMESWALSLGAFRHSVPSRISKSTLVSFACLRRLCPGFKNIYFIFKCCWSRPFSDAFVVYSCTDTGCQRSICSQPRCIFVFIFSTTSIIIYSNSIIVISEALFSWCRSAEGTNISFAFNLFIFDRKLPAQVLSNLCTVLIYIGNITFPDSEAVDNAAAAATPTSVPSKAWSV